LAGKPGCPIPPAVAATKATTLSRRRGRRAHRPREHPCHPPRGDRKFPVSACAIKSLELGKPNFIAHRRREGQTGRALRFFRRPSLPARPASARNIVLSDTGRRQARAAAQTIKRCAKRPKRYQKRVRRPGRLLRLVELSHRTFITGLHRRSTGAGAFVGEGPPTAGTNREPERPARHLQDPHRQLWPMSAS